MNVRVNPPHLQPGPVLFALACIVGLGFAGRGVLILAPGTEQWWVGAFALLIIGGGFLVIIGGWLWIQREVTLSDGRVIVRRWVSRLIGRPGRVIPLGDGTTAAITLRNVCSLRIERNGVSEALLTLGYWGLTTIRQLVDALRANDIPLDHYWQGDYPPGT